MTLYILYRSALVLLSSSGLLFHVVLVICIAATLFLVVASLLLGGQLRGGLSLPLSFPRLMDLPTVGLQIVQMFTQFGMRDLGECNIPLEQVVALLMIYSSNSNAGNNIIIQGCCAVSWENKFIIDQINHLIQSCEQGMEFTYAHPIWDLG